ncbi:hypothetical protein CDD83_8272 [Cordyceps sp. RAO-2017]|nr:hypothetical protein CDD83_8272 [Cordyceps sp. RAO-2017]
MTVPAPKRPLADESGLKLVLACCAGNINDLNATLRAVRTLPLVHLPPDQFLLQTAAKEGRAECTRFLFQHLRGCIARPDKRWDPYLPEGVTYRDIPDKWRIYENGVIHEALSGKDPIGLFRVFLDFGIDPNISLDVAGSPLAQAVATNQLRLTEYLLSKGADPNGYYMSNTLLGVAARLPDADVLRVLLLNGAQVAGSRALQQAAQYWRIQSAEVLLEHGASLDEVFTKVLYDDNMRPAEFPLGCALHFAIQSGKRDSCTASQSGFIRYLIGRGAKTDLVDEKEETPLQMAQRLGKAEIVQIIESGKV